MIVRLRELWKRVRPYGYQAVEDAWSDGYHTGDNEVDDFIAGKDDFIAKQEQIIVRLIKVVDLSEGWKHVPDDLHEQLRDYA